MVTGGLVNSVIVKAPVEIIFGRIPRGGKSYSTEEGLNYSVQTATTPSTDTIK